VLGDVIARYVDGARVLFASEPMRTAYAMAVVGAVLGNASLQLLPVVADECFGMGSGAVGAMAAGFGAGAIVAAVIQVRLNEHWGRALVVQRMFGVFAVAMGAFAISPHLVVAVAALAVAGAAYLHCMGTCSTAIHLFVPDEFRGRVVGFYMLGWTMAFPIGSLVQGWAAEAFGVRATIGVSAALMVAAAGVATARPRILASLSADPISSTPAAT
jgi:predicted MFS family arabinose efflux permease